VSHSSVPPSGVVESRIVQGFVSAYSITALLSLQSYSPSFTSLAGCAVFHCFIKPDRDEPPMNPRTGCAASSLLLDAYDTASSASSLAPYLSGDLPGGLYFVQDGVDPRPQ
jgi:hypothetical protein